MYKISRLSGFFGISAKTLRLYERKGLLLPSRRDAQNNYRYYDHRDIARLSAIRELKHFGLNLDEIRRHFEGEPVLESKLCALKAERARLELLIARLECLSAEGFARCRVSRVAAEHCVRREVSADGVQALTMEMGRFFDYALEKGYVLNAHHGVSAEYEVPPCRVKDGAPIRATLCLSLSKPCEESVELPETDAAHTFFQGTMPEMLQSYELLAAFLEDRSLRAAGAYREYYLDPLTKKNGVTTPIVHLVVPVVKKQP